MKLIEAQTRIEKLAYVPFKEYLLPNQVQDAMMKINKGKTGQLLELTIGLELSNTPLDFEDGELKMNVEIKTYHKEMKPSRSFSIFHSQFSIIFWVLD